MVSADLPEVAAIYADRTGVEPPPSWLDRVSELLDRPHGTVAVVAGEGGRVLGYLVGEVRSWEFGSGPAGWIVGVGVSRASQGSGVGRQLIDAALAGFRAAGVDAARTMVRRDDVDVLRFFRNAGFAAGPYTELELEL